jgi:hypothetical protein
MSEEREGTGSEAMDAYFAGKPRVGIFPKPDQIQAVSAPEAEPAPEPKPRRWAIRRHRQNGGHS